MSKRMSVVDRPTISSVRRSSRAPSTFNFRVPSLPKLHGRRTLISTKLCEQMLKSTAGHVFDLSSSREYYPFLEYNSLHDPHLKSYYYRAQMKQKLVKNGYVTPHLRVVCRSLKEYNAYRNFLELEFMKLRKRDEEEKRERERKRKSEESGTKQQWHSSTDKEREQKRKSFFYQQEKKLQAKQLLLRKRERREHSTKLKLLEERRVQREKNEIKREAEREQRKLRQLKREHEEALRRKSLLRQNEMEDYMRRIHLNKLKQDEKISHLNELERRWQIYEDHAQKAKEEEEARKMKEKEERERRMRRREKIFQILQKREDERKLKLMEENHQQVEILKQEADMLEKKWMEKKMTEVSEWKEKINKKQEHWDRLLQLQRDQWRKEHEKHVEELLSHPNAPHLHTASTVRTVHKFSGSMATEIASTTSDTSKRKTSNTVRFSTTPTVHIFEEPLVEEGGTSCYGQWAGEESLSNEEELLLKVAHDHETLDHKDSYELHYERSKDQSSSSSKMMVDDMEEETMNIITSEDELDQQDHIELMEECFEDNSQQEIMDEAASLSSPQQKESLISLQKSTASDLVNTALQNAVEEVVSLSQSPTLTSPVTVEEKESLISLQKSTASDLVNTALQNAVEHVSSLSLKQ